MTASHSSRGSQMSAEDAFSMWNRHKDAMAGVWPYPKAEMDVAVAAVVRKVQAKFGFTPQMPKDSGFLGILLERHFGWPLPGELYQIAFEYEPHVSTVCHDLSETAQEHSLDFEVWMASLKPYASDDSASDSKVDSNFAVVLADKTLGVKPAKTGPNYELF